MSYLVDRSPEFVEAIQRVENNVTLAKRSGEYKAVDGEFRWFPGRSPEGGLPTLAWGHKLTPREWETKRINFTLASFNETKSRDFRYGMSDEEVTLVLLDDLRKAEDQAKSDWNKYQKITWDSLPDKYKGVLINLCFNSGSLVKKGKWIWTTVAAGIHKNDDVLVTKGMVTSYKKPDGTRVQLTTRAIEIAKGLGLPWQILQKIN